MDNEYICIKEYNPLGNLIPEAGKGLVVEAHIEQRIHDVSHYYVLYNKRTGRLKCYVDEQELNEFFITKIKLRKLKIEKLLNIF